MTNTTWAGRSASPPTPEDDNPRAGWIPIAGVIAALGLVAAGGYVLGSSDSTTDTTAAPTTTMLEAVTTDTEVDADDSATDESAGEDAPRSTEAEDSATEDSSTDASADDSDTEDSATEDSATEDSATDDSSTESSAANQVVLEEGQVRGALLRDGVLYLGGAVPSQEVADQIIERAEAVVGEGNVISEYVIDPEAELVEGAPLYVDDVILFAYGASTYDPQFEPLLDLGLLLLSQNPSVTITVITHTDASGSDSFNDRLSLQRGQSVAEYWIDRGIPAEQIVIDARGERDPRADDHTPEGAQLNRRAEFYVDGLLP